MPHLIVPGPGGVPFSQALARSLADEPWLAFACGRYEGLDERVYEHAADRMPVTVVSLGDYVLNGGEVAVLAMVEAVGRLLPGVVGNAESLVEESHEDGLLEYPVYTRPASWDDAGTVRDVPPVLLSGDHGAIAAWRHAAAARAHGCPAPRPAAGVGDGRGAGRPRRAGRDARRCRRAARAAARLLGARGAGGAGPLGGAAAGGGARRRRGRAGGVDDVCRARAVRRTAHRGGWSRRCAGGCARSTPRCWEVGRLMVAPDLQGRGLGRELLALAEFQLKDSEVRAGTESVRSARAPRPRQWTHVREITRRVTRSGTARRVTQRAGRPRCKSASDH